MEILPQLSSDEAATSAGHRPFRIFWRSWLVFAIYVAFCALWPVSKDRPLLSATWGVYFAASFLAGAVAIAASWIAYRLARRSNSAGNFLFLTVITLAFCVTTVSMVQKADLYGVNGSRPVELVAAAPSAEPEHASPRGGDLKSGILSITEEARRLASGTAAGAERDAEVNRLISNLDAAAGEGASTGTKAMLLALKGVQDDMRQLQSAFRSFHRGGGLDASTLDSTTTLQKRIALARDLRTANERSLAFLEKLSPAGAPVPLQFLSTYKVEGQTEFRHALEAYVQASLDFFDFLGRHWGQWHFDKKQEVMVLAPEMSPAETARYDQIAEAIGAAEERLMAAQKRLGN